MSDRMDAVLASIDQALAECICGNPIPADGPSLDYCSDVCQYRYTAQQAGTDPDPELVCPIPPAETDGRAINDRVNAWFDRSNQRPPWSYYEDDEDTPRETPTRPVDRYTMGSYHTPPQDLIAGFDAALPHIVWCPSITNPAAPTAAELGAGVTLGVLDREGRVQTERSAVVSEMVQRSTITYAEMIRVLNLLPDNVREAARAWEDAFEQVASAAQLTTEEMAQLIQQIHNISSTAPARGPVTGEEFRRRALEARRNRGTGPQRRDNRRWRNT